jgi:hypothetical protein
MLETLQFHQSTMPDVIVVTFFNDMLLQPLQDELWRS